ncbi:MAG TPA: type II secretion system F family protein [Microbacteriaceae bacterium]|jgi:type II secretory pathway component PulF|nr:type II secretion system F family protein [Microbacteriaceae bacterium]
MLLEAGLAPIDAFEQEAADQEDEGISRALCVLRDHLVRGGGLTDAIDKKPEFLPIDVQLALKTGERTGRLAEALRWLYEELSLEVGGGAATLEY